MEKILENIKNMIESYSTLPFTHDNLHTLFELSQSYKNIYDIHYNSKIQDRIPNSELDEILQETLNNLVNITQEHSFFNINHSVQHKINAISQFDSMCGHLQKFIIQLNSLTMFKEERDMLQKFQK